MALVVGFVAFVVLDSPLGVLALFAGATIEVGELVLWTRYLRRYRVRTGAEGLIGRRGVVTSECRPRAPGQVQVHGALWRAVPSGEEPLEIGAEVSVAAVEGLTLTVASTGRRA